MKKQYFCNPLNMDYRYQFIQDMRSGEDKISREAADPSMILFHRGMPSEGRTAMYSVPSADWRPLLPHRDGQNREPPAAGQPAAV